MAGDMQADATRPSSSFLGRALASINPWSGPSAAEREAERLAHLEQVRAKNAANFRKGLVGTTATGCLAVLAALLCKKSVVARRYKPNMFQGNVTPPPFNPMKDAARAVVDATLLAGSLFALGMTGTFWYLGVGNLREFGRVLTKKYNQTSSEEAALMNDPESDKIAQDLGNLVFRRKAS